MISLRSKITQAVLNYFFIHEEAEAYQNELSQRLELDSGNLHRKLRELEREGIFRSRVQGKERFYSLNKDFPLLDEYRRIILKTTGFEHQLRAVLSGLQGLKQVMIFGSYAKDQMDASSDIDILAVGNHSSVALTRKLSELQKNLDRELNVVNMSPAEFDRKKRFGDKLIKQIKRGPTVKIL